MKPFEIWKNPIKKSEKEIIKNKDMGIDAPQVELSGKAEEILSKIDEQVKSRNELAAMQTEQEFIEEDKIIGEKATESEIGKIERLKKEGKTKEVEKLIESN